MAKSIYEPKKLVRYADNVNSGNSILAAQPLPVVAAPTPTPVTVPVVVNTTPPPPTPETKAFSFDGSTFLTGSYPATLGTKPFYGNLYSVTITPGWGNGVTGSFGICSISNVDGDNNEGFNVYVQRTYDGTNYQEYLGTEYIKDSIVRGGKRPLLNTLASGSTLHLQFVHFAGGITSLKENNTFNFNRNQGAGYGATSALQGASNLSRATGSFNITIGGNNSFAHPSGSQPSPFQGTMANFIVKNYWTGLGSSPVTSAQYDDPDTLVAYKFEGIVSASVGGSNLDVVGTESYIDYA